MFFECIGFMAQCLSDKEQNEKKNGLLAFSEV